MTISLVCILLLMFYKAKLAATNDFHHDYLSHKNTTVINGIFVLLVYLSHSSAKVALTSNLDTIYLLVKNHLLQLVVVTFLFYSGYGMGVSLLKKPDYIQVLMKNRLPKLFLHFNVVVGVYVCVQYLLGKTYPLKHILLAMIGWTSVGNSNWYIFVILLLYVFMIVASYIAPKMNPFLMITITTIFTILYICIMIKIGKPTRFYNTVLCFNFGLYYAYFKSKIDAIVMKNNLIYCLIALLWIASYLCFYTMRDMHILCYIMWTFSFMAILLLLSMKIELNSNVLHWFGSNVFGIYILQRIPMNILCVFGFQQYPYAFVIVCFIITIIMTLMLNLLLKKMDDFIFQRKKG